MSIGWLTCNLEVLLPHSLCRSTTANAPANRQMPIASVVRCNPKKEKRLRTIIEMIKDKTTIQKTNGDSVMSQAPFIISASRATDIPGFYADWFIERLKQGYVKWKNPFNGVPPSSSKSVQLQWEYSAPSSSKSVQLQWEYSASLAKRNLCWKSEKFVTLYL